MTDAVKALRALCDACDWVPSNPDALPVLDQVALWDQAKAALATGLERSESNGATEGSQPHTVDATGWRDISTAPKDWRNVLLYPSPDGFNDDVVVGFFTPDTDEAWFTHQDSFSKPELVTPTHWQPLPPPPGEEVETRADAAAINSLTHEIEQRRDEYDAAIQRVEDEFIGRAALQTEDAKAIAHGEYRNQVIRELIERAEDDGRTFALSEPIGTCLDRRQRAQGAADWLKSQMEGE